MRLSKGGGGCWAAQTAQEREAGESGKSALGFVGLLGFFICISRHMAHMRIMDINEPCSLACRAAPEYSPTQSKAAAALLRKQEAPGL